MSGLFPIIRRIRRPLLPPESLQTASDPRVVPPVIPPSSPTEGTGAEEKKPAISEQSELAQLNDASAKLETHPAKQEPRPAKRAKAAEDKSSAPTE